MLSRNNPVKLRVKATPNARSNEMLGWEQDPRVGQVLRLRIAAPPVEGRANEAIRGFLAETLGLSKSQVLLEKGDTSRIKTFIIPEGTRLPG